MEIEISEHTRIMLDAVKKRYNIKNDNEFFNRMREDGGL